MSFSIFLFSKAGKTIRGGPPAGRYLGMDWWGKQLKDGRTVNFVSRTRAKLQQIFVSLFPTIFTVILIFTEQISLPKTLWSRAACRRPVILLIHSKYLSNAQRFHLTSQNRLLLDPGLLKTRPQNIKRCPFILTCHNLHQFMK